MLKEGKINTGEVTINYVEGPPSGPPLVLLHGLTGRWQAFLPVMPALMLRWHLYALDLRGHGLSGRVAGKYRFADYAQDVKAFLRSLVAEPAVLLGHSLGGMVAIQVGAELPEKVRALVLEDPPLYLGGRRFTESPFYPRFVAQQQLLRSSPSFQEVLAGLAKLLPEVDAAGLRFRARSLCQADPDVLTRVVEGNPRAGYDLEALLSRIQAPTLLIQGDPSLGAAVSDDDAQRAVSLLRHGALVRFPGVGHGIHTAQTLQFLRVVTDFLESL
mgnify:CR=1 FL=1